MPPFSEPQQKYDPRWFIWTIVFLLATGVSLVTYIMLSSDEESDASISVTTHRNATK